MKKIIFILFVVMVPFLAFGQSGLFHKTITVTLDNGTDSAYVWQAFLSNRWTTDLSATLVDPSDEGGFLGNLMAYIYIDSVKATEPTLDSLAWGILRTDHDGVPIGDTLWVDDNATTTLSASLTYTRTFNVWRVRNRGTSNIDDAIWIDLRGEFEDWLGIKHLFFIYDYGVDDSLQVHLHTNQMR